jgi:P4 family phage/plasmid primase-like protien
MNPSRKKAWIKVIQFFFDELGTPETREKYQKIIKQHTRHIYSEKNLQEACSILLEILNKTEKISLTGNERKTTLDDIVERVDYFEKEELRQRIGIFHNKREMAKVFWDRQPFYYDTSKIWWLWDFTNMYWKQIDDTDLMNVIASTTMEDTVNSKQKAEILEAMRQVGRERKPKIPPKNWLQFNSYVVDINTKETFEVTYEYFFTNPIPWELTKHKETPIIDKLFSQWVGENNIKQLKQIIAYCCYPDYPIHSMFCLIGSGRNGKSKFLGLLSKFIGKDNLCSTELDFLIANRFETFKLYKKLVCTMGETNFGLLKNTSLLKKLTGQDLVGFEMKNKNPFDEINYAKILIASNSLPTSTDTSEGFYRRWIIIDFPNEFPEGKDILETIPDTEYCALARQVVDLLPKLLKDGKFHNQGSIPERKQKYILASNPLPIFLKDYCERDESSFILFNEFYTEFIKFLAVHKKRRVTSKEVKVALEDEGCWVERTSKKLNDTFQSATWVTGIRFKTEKEQKRDKESNCADYVNYAQVSTYPLTSSIKSKTMNNLHNLHKNQKSLKIKHLIFRFLQNDEELSFEEILEKIKENGKKIDEFILIDELKVLSEKGDIFEYRPGFWRLL